MSIITPPPYGRPDYSAPLQALDAAANEYTASVPANGNVQVFSQTLAEYNYLDMVINSASGNLFLEFSETNPIGAPGAPAYYDYLPVYGHLGTFPLYYHIPLYAPEVTLIAYDQSGGVNDLDIWTWGSNRVGRAYGPASLGGIINSHNGGLPPGGTTQNWDTAYSGPVVFTLLSSGTCNVQINYYSGRGDWYFLWGMNDIAASQPISEMIALPAVQTQVVLTNTTATNQSFDYSVTPFSNMAQ